jgi:hypothetical protein
LKPAFNAAARLKGLLRLKAGHVVDGAGNQAWYFHMNLHRDGAPAWIGKSGTRKWYSYGRLNRADGPAIEWADGDREWYKDNRRHREDGPAVEKTDGYKAWYVAGKLHREDGPAVIHPDGRREWFKDGEVWNGGAAVTDRIEAEQKAQKVEDAVKNTTVADEPIKVFKPLVVKKKTGKPAGP